MIPECVDKFGRLITVGSYIVYGHLLDRSAGLRVGKVLGLRYQNAQRAWDRGWRITTMGVDDGWDANKPKLCAKKGTLMFADRTVVVPFDILPEKYKKLYRDAELAPV